MRGFQAVTALVVCLTVNMGWSNDESLTPGAHPAVSCAGPAKTGQTNPRFTHLKEAVTFIVQCLDNNDHQSLSAACMSPDPMTNRIAFDSLKATHRKTPLDRPYAGREFPKDGTAFKLGGHMKELNCVHIDFKKTDRGWALERIWVCK